MQAVSPSGEGWYKLCGAIVACCRAAPCGWLRFGVAFAFCAMADTCVLCCSVKGDKRMRAIERIMRRMATYVPRSLLALQAATDAAACIPGSRRFHLAFSGMDVHACRATAEFGSGEWLWTGDAGGPIHELTLVEDERRLVIYIHGGAFALCGPGTHGTMTCRIAHATAALVLAVGYRRAPQHSFPAALEDVFAVYQTVIRSFPPSRIVVMGESAGGNLSVALCLKLQRSNVELPGGLILISPWLDLSHRCWPSWSDTKDYLHQELLSAFIDAYVNTGTVKDELTSPLLANDLRFLPQTLLIYGGAEHFRGQSERFAERMGPERIRVVIGADMVHGFPIFGGVAYGQLGRCIAFGAAAVLALVLLAAAVLAAFAVAYCDACADRGLPVAAVAVVAVASAAALFRAWRLFTRLQCGETSCDETGADLANPLEAFEHMKVFAAQIWQDAALVLEP